MRPAPLAALCLAAAVIASPQGAKADDAPLRVRVMAFNLRYDNPADGDNRWAHRADLALSVIADADADFIGLQEAMPHQIAALLQGLPDYAHVGRSRERDERRGEAVPILYRKDRWKLVDQATFWLSDSPDEPGSTGWGNTIPRIATLATFEHAALDRRVTVLNTHFDHQSQPARLRSAAAVVRRLGAIEGPVVLTGDLNADEQNPALAALRDAGWIDTFRVRHPDEKSVHTYHAFTGEPRGGKIDYVMVRQGVRVVDADILRVSRDGRYPSDHFPVWAVVEFDR